MRLIMGPRVKPEDDEGRCPGSRLGANSASSWVLATLPCLASAAWQAFAGGMVALSDRFSIFGEVRFQSAFGEVDVTDSSSTYPVEYNRTVALIGLRVTTD
ncbi:MAG: hypothetical protein WD230_05660 [Cucumibacter sp.]